MKVFSLFSISSFVIVILLSFLVGKFLNGNVMVVCSDQLNYCVGKSYKLKTIQQAVDKVLSDRGFMLNNASPVNAKGVTIYLQAGTYKDKVVIKHMFGKKNNPVSIEPFPRATVVIEPSRFSDHVNHFTISESDWIEISNGQKGGKLIFKSQGKKIEYEKASHHSAIKIKRSNVLLGPFTMIGYHSAHSLIFINNEKKSAFLSGINFNNRFRSAIFIEKEKNVKEKRNNKNVISNCNFSIEKGRYDKSVSSHSNNFIVIEGNQFNYNGIYSPGLGKYAISFYNSNGVFKNNIFNLIDSDIQSASVIHSYFSIFKIKNNLFIHRNTKNIRSTPFVFNFQNHFEKRKSTFSISNNAFEGNWGGYPTIFKNKKLQLKYLIDNSRFCSNCKFVNNLLEKDVNIIYGSNWIINNNKIGLKQNKILRILKEMIPIAEQDFFIYIIFFFSLLPLIFYLCLKFSWRIIILCCLSFKSFICKLFKKKSKKKDDIVLDGLINDLKTSDITETKKQSILKMLKKKNKKIKTLKKKLEEYQKFEKEIFSGDIETQDHHDLIKLFFDKLIKCDFANNTIGLKKLNNENIFHGIGMTYNENNDGLFTIGRWEDGKKILNQFTTEEITQKFRKELKDIVLICEIGSGGSSTIFKAKFNNQLVAYKRLNLNYGKDEGKFKKYVSNLFKIHHKNIIGFKGFVNEEKQKGVISELGLIDIEKLIKKETLKNCGFDVKLHILHEVSKGMKYLHTKADLLHKDLKWSNIILIENESKTGVDIKIIDFDISTGIDRSIKTVVTNHNPAGTKGFVSPEIFEVAKNSYVTNTNNEELILTPSADVYSFGVMIYSLICSVSEFDLKVDTKTGVLITNFENKIWKNRKSIKELIKRCIDKEQKNRPSFKEIENLLAKQYTFNRELKKNLKLAAEKHSLSI